MWNLVVVPNRAIACLHHRVSVPCVSALRFEDMDYHNWKQPDVPNVPAGGCAIHSEPSFRHREEPP